MSSSTDFDDLVIGAGSAGVPLAARLSEDPGRRVALVEAGPDYPTVADTPPDLLDGNVMSMAAHDWRFAAEAVAGRSIRFPRGRVVGGSSAVGGTVALRALPGDFDGWAAAGNPQWSWDRVLPYYRMMEDDLDYGDDEFHGRGGPIPIRRWKSREMTPVQQFFVDACLDAGYSWSDDHNHPLATGIGAIPTNRPDLTTRASTAMGYLPAARGRENLTILAGGVAGRVVVRDGRVHGVEVRSASGVRTITARRVVLSAGSIGSPAILLRSGIGPADELRGLGIDPTVDLPGVGAGLMDHPRTGVFMTPKPGAENFGDPLGQVVLRTTLPGSDQANDMHYYMVNGFDLTQQFPNLREVAGADRMFGVMVVAQLPHSRGRVGLVSSDPRTAPRIDMNYLSDEADHRIFATGLRTAWELAHTSKIFDQADRHVMLDEATVQSDDALLDYARLTLDSTYHPVGTVRMGPATDPGTVVDERCAVHGVEGLHVADASIMPANVRANTNLTSIMIGERAAALLRAS